MALYSTKYPSQSGSLLVEIVLSIAVFAVLIPSIISGLITSRQGEPASRQRQLATAAMQTTSDQIRSVREKGWDLLVPTGAYYPAAAGNSYILLSGSQTTADGLSRYVRIDDVYRDNNGQIGASGIVDPSTRKITTIINWWLPEYASMSAESYFTRYLDNLTWPQTTYSDFSVGTTLTGVAVEYTGGSPTDGQVVLSGGGHGDWCQPTLTQWGYNLGQGGAGKALSAIEGQAYVVKGDASGGSPFYKIAVTQVGESISASLAGSWDSSTQSYGVYGNSTHAYITTKYTPNPDKAQGVIIDLATNTKVGVLDTQDGSKPDGNKIIFNENYIYLSTSNNKIYIFNVATPSGIKTPSSSLTLNSTVNNFTFINGKIYAALNSSSNQLVIIPITGSGGSFGSPEYVTVDGENGRDVFVNSSGTRAYLAASASAGKKEMFVVDIDSVSATYKQTLASQDTNGMNPNGISAVTNNKVIAVGTGGTEYQVYNYNDSTKTFSACGTGTGMLDMGSFEIYDIATLIQLDGSAYSYLLTSDSSNEFKIIQGGPSGGAAYSGTYISPIHDFGTAKAFNHLFYTAQTQNGVSAVNFQIAIADPVSGSCNGANYVFQAVNTDGSIPFDDNNTGYENPGRCLRYRALFTTNDLTRSPVLYDVTLNYSP